MYLLIKLGRNILSNLKKHSFFLFFFLVGIQLQVVAQELRPIYELEISVREEEGIDQTKLIRQAIEEVLVRTSGSDKVLNLDLVKEALSYPDKYVKQLSYHQRATERSIKILFNENLINQLLTKVKRPAWQKERPLVLVWLMKEQEWIGPDTPPFSDEMAQVLTKRAIPFVFPLLDLVDVAQVSELDVCNGVLEPLRESAKRYNPDVILLGRLQNHIDQWQGNWTLLKENSEVLTWSNEAQNLNILLNETAEELALKLRGASVNVAENDVVEKAVTRHLSLAVVGILNVEQYTKVLEYLRQLPTVVEVEVSQIMPEKTVFNLQMTADKETLIKSINEGSLLIEDTSVVNESFEGELFYKIFGMP